MRDGTTHIVGAGLAGLAAGVRLSEQGRKVVVHELARHAGGRCRSYFEPALGLEIDNGNHLLLSGNARALAFLDTIGGRDRLGGPSRAEFAFVDLAEDTRWVLRPNSGPLPWWVLFSSRRVPGTRALDYAKLASLLSAGDGQTVADVIGSSGPLYEKLMRPVLLAALNVELTEASATLASAVIRETLAKGGKACRPLIAAEGLGPALVDPAVAFIGKRGGDVRFDHGLRAISFDGDRATWLTFAEDQLELGAGDDIILAVPGWVARTLIPGLVVPNEYRAILNAHFKIAPPPSLPKITGVVNATTEWLFAFSDRLSVTVSAADRFNETEREPVAREIWGEVSKIAGIDAPLPPWQIVKERRATFAATPAQNAMRPSAATRWTNLYLAGDFTATGLPATIEGSIRSGETAAKLAVRAPF